MQALWMIAASLLFAVMGVCVKYASVAFTSVELIFYRGVIGVVFIGAFSRMVGTSLRTPFPKMHAWRSLVGVVSLGAWFYAIANLPLATAVAINYMSSIWIAVFVIAGTLFAWSPEKSGKSGPIQGRLVLSVVAGFAGVLLLLRPELPGEKLFAGLVGVLSSVTAAFAYMHVVALSRVGEPETRTVFYFAMGSAAAGGLVMVFAGVSPWSWHAAAWLLPVGILAASGQWCMTRAYSGAHTEGHMLVVANLQYSGIIFSAVLGYLLLDERITWVGWAGMALIIASGIVSTILRVKALPEAPAEER
jgi:drug/metabolite transporter (DMT)-like permease